MTTAPGTLPLSPPTPDVKRRIVSRDATVSLDPTMLTIQQEENRLKAKALREQHEAAQRAAGRLNSVQRTESGFTNTADISLAGAAGRKRSHAAISTTNVPETQRDARNNASSSASAAGVGSAKAGEGFAKPLFTKYVDYDFGKMTDTKGGFLSADDDPHNKQLQAPADADGGEKKPAHMTLREWERHRLLKELSRRKEGMFEPGLSVLTDKEKRKTCRECGSLEIDWTWDEVFGCAVCGLCKEKYPEKYSLLTKTEVKDDYLITEPELRDAELLPHLNKPNPHKSHWHDMWLFLRFQVEEYAFSERKWGSAEELDREFERRQEMRKRQKEDKFKAKLVELKRKTRTEQYRKSMRDGGGAGATFGSRLGGDRHEHEWGRAVVDADGNSVKKCVECGMEVEELEF
jgi:DNA-repair protein complementing XP-A cells